MADPLLSTLCAICHAEPKKYKCPGCGVQTCSLPCTQKHKARADCSGQRNPRAFVPVALLRTQAGVDHDYNYLSSIERAKQRLEKEIVEDRRLLSAETLRPVNEDRQYNKVWQGEELRFVRQEDARRYKFSRFGGNERAVRRRLKIMDIELLEMPKGLQRYRENKTALNRRTLSLNWQVEWLVYGRDGQVKRILRKMLDETFLSDAVTEALRWHQAQLERDQRGGDGDVEPPAKRRRLLGKRHKGERSRETGQDPISTAWPCTDYTFQSCVTAVWDHVTDSATVPQTTQEQSAEMALWQFFLLKAGQGLREKALIPISSANAPLHSVLSGRTVVEFPTIYVLPPGAEVPEGFGLGSIERRVRKGIDEDLFKDEDEAQPANRKRAGPDHESRRPTKQTRFGQKRVAFAPHSTADNGEDGEINSDGENVEMRDDGSITSSATISTVSSDTSSPQDQDGGAAGGPPLEEMPRDPPQHRSALVDYDSADDSD